MKTITCRAMGGMCDEAIQGESMEEVISAGMKHLEVTHPEMAADVKSMPADHPMMVKWSEDFKKSWDNAPEM